MPRRADHTGGTAHLRTTHLAERKTTVIITGISNNSAKRTPSRGSRNVMRIGPSTNPAANTNAK